MTHWLTLTLLVLACIAMGLASFAVVVITWQAFRRPVVNVYNQAAPTPVRHEPVFNIHYQQGDAAADLAKSVARRLASMT